MRADTEKRSYTRDLKLASTDALIDAVIYLVCALAFGTALLMLVLDRKAAEAAGEFRAAAISGAAMLLALSLNGLATAVVRRKAVRDVTSESVYAVKLTGEQQDLIFRVMARQIALSCLAVFLILSVPLTAILLVKGLSSGDGNVLKIMAAADVLWLVICLFSFLFEIADLRSRDGFCTVSGKGIITAGKVYDFDSSLGDVTGIICFDDSYSIRFKRRSFFWVRLDTEYPLPAGGSVSRELREHDERKVLTDCLIPGRTAELDGAYRRVKASELALLTDRTAERAESLTDGLGTDEENDAPLGLRGYVTRIAAAVLIAAVGLFTAYVYAHGWPDIFRKKTEPVPVEPDPPIVDPEPEPDPEPELVKYKLWESEEGAWYFTYNDQDILFVDDEHPMSRDFGGKDRTANDALELMYNAAEDDGITLYTVKGYRSYDKQAELYVSYDVPDWAVKEGLSEHQSGLAFDIDLMGVAGTMQDVSFEKTDAFSWLVDHGAEYGFILRYPKDKTGITGRIYEPWHFRYVGTELARYLKQEGLTLDEIVEP